MCEGNQETFILTIPNIIQIITFIFVLLSYLFSFYLYKIRQNKQRYYDSEYDLYTTLIIKNINELINFAMFYETEFNKLINNCKTEIKRGNEIRETIEDACDRIDNKREDFQRSVLPITYCYQKCLKDELENISENFHDDITPLFTSITNSIVDDHLKTSNLLNKFAKIKEKYLTEILNSVRNSKPMILK